jgi:hypothetical protein
MDGALRLLNVRPDDLPRAQIRRLETLPHDA